MKELYAKLEYREFLKDFYEKKKVNNSHYSYRLMAQKVDMDVSYLVKVISGKRHIPVDKIEAFVHLCSLKGAAVEYFENLVYFNRAKTQKEQKPFLENLIRLRSVKGYALSAAQYKYYSKWHYTAIRGILGLHNWCNEYEEIAKKLDPPLRAHQVEQAITFMLKLGLVVRDKNGFLKPADRHISSGQAVDKQAVRNYQEAMMDMAKRSLWEHSPAIRDISTITIAVNESSIADIKAIITKCREEIRKRIDLDDTVDSVYQINFQLFPLTRNHS
jgi:uncharacterized protein (TIGR02147 family)